MGVGNNSSTKSLLSGFESADRLEPSVRKVIQSLQDAVVNLQEEVQNLTKSGTPEAVISRTRQDQLSIEAGQGIKVVSVCNRRIICNTQQAQSATVSGGSSVAELVVVAEYGDYIECQTIVTSGYPATVYVAKPFSFRLSTWKNQTISGVSYTQPDPEYSSYRQASYTDVSSYYEYQMVTPEYYNGENIVAVNRNTGLFTDTSETGQAESTPIIYEDINNSGRAWSASPFST
jgi:hypothetical protein